MLPLGRWFRLDQDDWPTGSRFAVVIFVVVLAVFIVVAIVGSWSATAWAALGTWATAGIATAAGVVALGQLRETRGSRREQTQPYVVAYIDLSAASTWICDLVIRNYGATPAYGIHLDINPRPKRSVDAHRPPGQVQGEVDWLPNQIPVLVPGQEWRTLWDTGDRAKTDLPDHHDVTISYRDSHERPYEIKTVLDWRVVKDRDIVAVYGEHHAAKALSEINNTLAKWKESPAGGLRVWTRDGDVKDRQRRAERAKFQAEQETGRPEQDPPLIEEPKGD